MEFSLVIMSALARHCSFQNVDCERYESSAENRRPTVGQCVHPKMPGSSVDAHRERRLRDRATTNAGSGDAYT